MEVRNGHNMNIKVISIDPPRSYQCSTERFLKDQDEAVAKRILAMKPGDSILLEDYTGKEICVMALYD
jgi:hypothetical protein